jgi:hypothetical protein
VVSAVCEELSRGVTGVLWDSFLEASQPVKSEK